MHLLEPSRPDLPFLLRAMYGLLMLLPQGPAFQTLHDRYGPCQVPWLCVLGRSNVVALCAVLLSICCAKVCFGVLCCGLVWCAVYVLVSVQVGERDCSSHRVSEPRRRPSCGCGCPDRWQCVPFGCCRHSGLASCPLRHDAKEAQPPKPANYFDVTGKS